MKLSIIVFGHGSVHGKKNILGGWMNLPLSSQGEADAKELAKELSRERIGVGFCSDLLRSKQVLAEVLLHHKSAKVIVDHRLRERHFGEKSVLGEELMGKNSKLYKNHREIYFGKVSRGENLHSVSKRVFPFMNDVLRFMKKERVNVAISAHRESLRLIVEFLEGLDHWEAGRLNISPKSYKKYVVDFG